MHLRSTSIIKIAVKKWLYLLNTLFVFNGTFKIEESNLLTKPLVRKISLYYLSQTLSTPHVSEDTSVTLLPKRELFFWKCPTLTMRELRHWPSITGVLPQSHCGDDDGCIGLSSLLHYICMYIYKLAWLGFGPTTTELRSDALTDCTIRPWVELALSQLCTATTISSFIQCLCLRQSPRLFQLKFSWSNHSNHMKCRYENKYILMKYSGID